MQTEGPRLGAQLLGRSSVSGVSSFHCVGHCLPFPRSHHREPDPSSLGSGALGQVWPIKSTIWRQEEARVFLTLFSSRGQCCALSVALLNQAQPGTPHFWLHKDG